MASVMYVSLLATDAVAIDQSHPFCLIQVFEKSKHIDVIAITLMLMWMLSPLRPLLLFAFLLFWQRSNSKLNV